MLHLFSFQQTDQVASVPKPISDASGHRRTYGQRAVNLDEIVGEVVQRDCNNLKLTPCPKSPLNRMKEVPSFQRTDSLPWLAQNYVFSGPTHVGCGHAFVPVAVKNAFATLVPLHEPGLAPVVKPSSFLALLRK